MLGNGGGSGKSARMAGASGLGALVLMLMSLQGVGAQEKTPSSKDEADRTLKGMVVDVATGSPLAGAFVALKESEWGTLSEADGSFTLKGVDPGSRSLVAQQLGYLPLEVTVEVKDPREPVVLSMEPDPELREGLQMVLDRFEQRRKATPTSSWVFNRGDLVTNSGMSALDFLEARTPIQLYNCGLGVECTMVQGRLTPVTVYVDEALMLGGTDYLRSRQAYDLQRVEVFAGGQHIRAYTEGYLSWAARGRILASISIF